MHSIDTLVAQTTVHPFQPLSSADASDLLWWLGYWLRRTPNSKAIIRTLITMQPVVHFPEGPHLTVMTLHQWLSTHAPMSPEIAALQPLLMPLFTQILADEASHPPANDEEEPILYSDKLMAAFWSGYGWAP